jgi:hypothetical protein
LKEQTRSAVASTMALQKVEMASAGPQVGREARWVGVEADAEQAIAVLPGGVEGVHEVHRRDHRW